MLYEAAVGEDIQLRTIWPPQTGPVLPLNVGGAGGVVHGPEDTTLTIFEGEESTPPTVAIT